MAVMNMFLLAAFAYIFNFVHCYYDVPCQPRPIAVPTRNGSKTYRESHILLYRCSGGGTKSQEHYMCAENETENVKINLHDMHFPDTETKSFVNHTKCGLICFCEKNGAKCPKNSPMYIPKCPPEQTWNKDTCQCQSINECPKESGTGNGGLNGGVSIPMFIVALIIEFIVVLIVVFLALDVCKYRHSTGIIFKTSQYIRHISNGESGGFKVPTLKRGREATGSVSFLYDVNNGNGAYEKVAV